MPSPSLSVAINRIAASVARRADPDPTDGRLLGRFVQSRDEPAFAELVRRLGPMVLGVCRRVTGHAHDADDAFQAAFVVLARRAADVTPREAVRPWLYGVAVRVAREARSVSAKRRTRETSVAVLPDQGVYTLRSPEDAEAVALLDEEVGRLPDHLRAAVVLCELNGVSRKDAAARLGVPEGTLSSRLGKARKLLAERLKARGVALGAGGLAVLTDAAVSPRLLAQTSAVATATAPLPAAVAALARGVTRTMFLHKLTLAAAGGLLLTAVAAGVGSPPRLTAQDPPKPAPAAKAEAPKPAAKPAGPGTLVVAREGAYWVLAPDGTRKPDLPLPDQTTTAAHPALSPDGTRVAVLVMKEIPPKRDHDGEPWPLRVAVGKLDGSDRKVWDLPAAGLRLSWTADGKKLIAAKTTADDPAAYESVLLDPATGETAPLDLPAGVRVLDAGRDGKTFVVEAFGPEADGQRPRLLGLAALGDQEVRTLTTLRGHPASCEARLSPDGKQVLFTDGDPERKDAHKWGMNQRPYRLDVATGKREPLADYPENAQARGVAWSPDGKRVAYTWQQLHPELLKKDQISGDDTAVETEAFLIVADTDGRNAKTVAFDKGPFAINLVFGAIDWR